MMKINQETIFMTYDGKMMGIIRKQYMNRVKKHYMITT